MSKPTIRTFVPRFVQPADLAELSTLWHLARTACAKPGGSSAYVRRCWAAQAFHEAHPEIPATAVYKDLDAMLSFGGRG